MRYLNIGLYCFVFSILLLIINYQERHQIEECKLEDCGGYARMLEADMSNRAGTRHSQESPQAYKP